ncbi:MutS family DNA mismatch repair protein [Desulforamulus ruminis]|uniref:DNA mismatch repair protein MutS domain protein n=1 Tax=Desulforamulus ruminis (strain ATCC 23193 / DSM 2154 / NCIMB 8452 / DL) TaxID=696281 RepID=F6DUJ2_DESRL|nr:MutS family DNA mismatch repair protein [Desulforamulus ruminis]AEG59059.1 DNA mismatch repair protein MutS domain protein [Desulforamulus ruminis DSM 2154]
MADKIESIYQTRKADFEDQLAHEKKKDNTLVLFRGLIGLIIVAILVFGYFYQLSYYLFYPVPLILLFLILVVKHQGIRNKITYLIKMIQINEAALLRLSDQWTTFIDTGEKFTDPDHRYSQDLNIFGRGSLYQKVNAATSLLGKESLAKLLSKESSLQEIALRQPAVQELGRKLDWRQHFQAIGMGNEGQDFDPIPLFKWAEEEAILINKKTTSFIWLLPLLTLTLFILAGTRQVSVYVAILPLIAQILIVVYCEKFIPQVFRRTQSAVSHLERYSSLLSHIERENFQSPLLLDLKDKLLTQQQASRQIQALAKIADRINLRYSPFVYLLINITTLWDLSTLRKLEQWKQQAGPSLKGWFQVVGELEALASLAILAHDHPEWVYPVVTEGKPSFAATDLGHPLISKNSRVHNDVSLAIPGTIFVITGSNMSGKSTLLRTIGINLVLAYAGAPVCAKNMKCSLMKIYTSMQVHDNLEQKTSTFYAELKRVKMVIDSAKDKKPMIFLLDEIFKGTNSKDRIFGAKTVIKNLSRLSTIGLVTTHDLELGTLADEDPEFIKNYHFTDKIVNGQITFDYCLKPGISQNTNAIALMKLIGIEV